MNAINPLLKQKINIVIIEDHILFRNSFIRLLNDLDKRFNVLYVADNGEQFLEKFSEHVLPDIVITDIKMKKMNGFSVIEWMKNHYSKIPLIALTMYNDPSIQTRLITIGARGVLYKDTGHDNIILAFETILSGGCYFEKPNPFAINEYYVEDEIIGLKPIFNIVEQKFAEHLCGDKQLREIASNMNISDKTAERYRTNLFQKLGVKTRIGFILYAMKNNLVKFR